MTHRIAVALACLALGLMNAHGHAASIASPDSVRALIAAGRFAEADSAAHRLLEAAQREHGPESLEAARALDLIVDAMRTWPEALPYAKRVVRIREVLPAQYDREKTESLMNLGRVYLHSGSYHDAREPFRKALAAGDRAFGPEDLYVARILNNLALCSEQDGDGPAAKSLYERAVEIRERNGSRDALLASTYVNLGRLCTELDELDEGETALHSALKIQEAASAADSSDIGTILVYLARLQHRSGRYVAALTSLKRALPLLDSPGADSVSLADGLDFRGTVQSDIGNYSEAKADFTTALRIREKLVGSDHQAVATSLDLLGVLNEQLGDHMAARPYLERALEIRLKRLIPTHPNIGISMLTLSRLLGELGYVARAESLCAQGIAILRQNFGEKNKLIAEGLTTAGMLRMKSGDTAGARTFYEEALAMQRDVLGADHPDAAATGIGLAHTLWSLGQRGEALAVALRSEASAREQFRLTERALSEREALRYAATRTNGLGLACSIARSGLADSLDGKVWDALIRTRALVLTEMAWRHRAVAAAGDTSATRLLARLTSVSSRLSGLMVRGPEGWSPEAYKGKVETARRQLEDTERQLAERSGTYRELRASEGIGLVDVQRALPRRAALVGFAKYSRSDPIPKGGQVRDEYIAFVMARDSGRVSTIPLGSASRIDSLVASFLAAARPSPPRAAEQADSEQELRRIGEKLRGVLWDPLVPAIDNARLVLIVPDGALSLIPFAALPVGRSAYLLERGPVIHYLSAERDVAIPWDASHAKDGLLAIGGSDFDTAAPFRSLRSRETLADGADSRDESAVAATPPYRGAHANCLELQSARFEPLPASAREVREIASLWGRGRRPLTAVLLGAAASEGSFKAHAHDAGVLHIATHGFFLDGRCVDQSVSDRGIGGISVEPMLLPRRPHPSRKSDTGVNAENPLLLSGLVFAGANHRDAASGQEDDGILTAEEIAALDLSGVRWAVLSACDTGKGEVAAGEGVLGLRRAFQIAGAGSLIMSLWPVDDRAALQWMRTFYAERVSRGTGMAEAVRRASTGLLRERRAAGQSTNPFYWAGFVAAGDWR